MRWSEWCGKWRWREEIAVQVRCVTGQSLQGHGIIQNTILLVPRVQLPKLLNPVCRVGRLFWFHIYFFSSHFIWSVFLRRTTISLRLTIPNHTRCYFIIFFLTAISRWNNLLLMPIIAAEPTSVAAARTAIPGLMLEIALHKCFWQGLVVFPENNLSQIYVLSEQRLLQAPRKKLAYN